MPETGCQKLEVSAAVRLEEVQWATNSNAAYVAVDVAELHSSVYSFTQNLAQKRNGRE